MTEQTTFKMLLLFVIAMIALLPAETMASKYGQLAAADDCKDHSHFNCHHIAENGNCDGIADKGENIGDVFCPVSCGRCKAESDDIFTDHQCYTFAKQQINILLQNAQPDQEDWVGIYPDDADPNQLGAPVAWHYSCGSKKDKCKTSVGSVTFPWLPPGKYRALMSRHHSKAHHKAPYSSYAQSEVFEVVRGNTCAARRRTKTVDDARKRLRGSLSTTQ